MSLLNDAASEMVYPLLPVFLTSSLGATPVVIGLIEGAADGLSSILKYFAGRWSDATSQRKPFVVWGYTLASASRAIIAAALVWPLVFAARLLDRTGKGIRSAPRDAMISDVTPAHQRGRAFGFQRALDHTGAIAGPLLAMLCLNVMGLTLRQTIYLAVIPGAVGVVLLIVLLKETMKDEPETTTEDRAGIHRPSLIAHRSSFRGAITAIALFSLANSSDAFLILQAHAAGVTTALLPLLWAAHHVIKSLFSTAAGGLSDRVDRRWLLVAGWASYAVIYAAFPFAHSLVAFFVLFILYAIPFTLAEGAERAWIADLVPAEVRGRSFGIYYLANGMGVLAGTALFGVIYQQVSPRAAFFTGAALAVAAVLAVLATRRKVTA